MAAWPQLSPRSPTADDPYIPHPAPNAPGNEDDPVAIMGAASSIFKTLIIPAVISLLLYLLISYLVVPLWKRYRGRYSQYLPLDSISTRTSSARNRVQTALVDAAARWLLPSNWRTEFEREQAAIAGGETSDFDEEEGEELYTVEDAQDNRREAISLDVDRRLSRDLEEGFKDDSDASDDETENRGSRAILR